MALQLDEIRVYPIKSLPGVRMKHARVMAKGLEYDRRFMLTDLNGSFMTQRTLPQLSQYDVSLSDGIMMIRSRLMPGAGEIRLDLNNPSPSGKEHPAVVWDDTVMVKEVDESISEWFSKTVGIGCRLVFFPEGNDREVDPDYASVGHQVSLADGYPFLIIGTASLEELNGRLTTPVTMDRFRPNFVFSGGAPFDEDRFRRFNIGSVTFAGVKPCSRCNLVTIDPQTGEAGAEPLRTLSTYRTRNNKVYFGQNLIALNHDHVNEGDEIFLA
jgi:uncharacterized protein